jgi:hypothetical protein
MDLNKAEWRKATRSLNNGGECVELADVARAALRTAVQSAADTH